MLKALPSTLKGGEFVSQLFVHECGKGVTIEMVQDPTYWSLVSNKVKPWDKIEIQAQDGTFWGELLVIDSENNRVVVELLRHREISRKVAPAEVPTGYEISHEGPRLKWSVIRKADQNRIKSGFSNEPDALSWIIAHVRSADRKAA